MEGFQQAIVEISKLQQHISDLVCNLILYSFNLFTHKFIQENAILVETQSKLLDNLNNFINTDILNLLQFYTYFINNIC